MTTPGLKQHTVVSRQENGVVEAITDFVAEEVPVAVVFNGVTHAVMMASPIDLEDFALGFSLTERIIDDQADIQKIEIKKSAQGIALQIDIKPNLVQRLKSRERSLSGRAGCGICGLTDIAAAVPKLTPLNAHSAPSHQAIDHAAMALQKKQTLQLASGGVHAAALCNQAGDLMLLREDVGRHNALDKLIGAAITVGKDTPFLPADFILMSSRASHELINKSVIAGVSSLVTLSAATSLAIEIAARARLNLVGFVRGKRQLVYFENP